jgi:hypothetical protein
MVLVNSAQCDTQTFVYIIPVDVTGSSEETELAAELHNKSSLLLRLDCGPYHGGGLDS